jgi:N-acetylmuramic acid 6-phosphate etherase
MGAPDLVGLCTEHRADDLADLDRRPTLDIVQAVVRSHVDVLAAVQAAEPAIAELADVTAERMDRGGRVIYAGAGTGGRIALVDASEWGPTFSVRDGAVVSLLAGAEEEPGSFAEAAAEDDAQAGAGDLAALSPTALDTVIGVSASGRTPYVLGALARAREAGALTAAVTSQPGSLAAHAADLVVEVPVGPEVICGSTRLKAGTAQKLVLNAFSTAVMVRRGRTLGNLMAGMRVANDKLRERALRVIVAGTGVDEPQARAALEAAGDDVGVAVVMIGRGVDVAAARQLLAETQGAIGRAIGLDQ